MAGQKYLVGLTIQQLGSSSLSLAYRFEKERKEHCLVEIVHVFCNRITKTKQPIPPEINEILQQHIHD